MRHVSSPEEAQKILEEFCAEHLIVLTTRAELARHDWYAARELGPPALPEGWFTGFSGNSIFARYQDGKQERQTFYVPSIYIDFELNEGESLCPKVEVITRRALGYCSCGRRMPLAQLLLRAHDMVESKQWLSRLGGRILGFAVGMWVSMSPAHQDSLIFNCHPKCL